MGVRMDGGTSGPSKTALAAGTPTSHKSCDRAEVYGRQVNCPTHTPPSKHHSQLLVQGNRLHAPFEQSRFLARDWHLALTRVLRHKNSVSMALACGGLYAGRPASECRNRPEGMTAMLPILNGWQRNPVPRFGRQCDQFTRARERQRLKNDSVENAVHGCGDADANCDNERCGNREARGTSKLTVSEQASTEHRNPSLASKRLKHFTGHFQLML